MGVLKPITDASALTVAPFSARTAGATGQCYEIAEDPADFFGLPKRDEIVSPGKLNA